MTPRGLAAVDVAPRAVTRMTPAQAAEYSDRSLTTIHRALAAAELHGSQRTKGGKWAIRQECVDAWLDNDACPHSNIIRLDQRKAAAR